MRKEIWRKETKKMKRTHEKMFVRKRRSMRKNWRKTKLRRLRRRRRR